MFHAKAEDRRRVVVADLFLLRIEADSLTDDGRLGAGSAPYCKGHFEADREDALPGLAGAITEGISAVV